MSVKVGDVKPSISSRRIFLEKAARASLVAPAVAVLMQAPAAMAVSYANCGKNGINAPPGGGSCGRA